MALKRINKVSLSLRSPHDMMTTLPATYGTGGVPRLVACLVGMLVAQAFCVLASVARDVHHGCDPRKNKVLTVPSIL